MIDPIKYPQYYIKHPDQLSEKIKDQLELSVADVVFFVGLILVLTLIFVLG